MANGIQLATAYISLNVRTDDIKGQVESALKGSGNVGRNAGLSMGRNIAGGIRSHMSSGSLGQLIFAPLELAGVKWAVRAGAAIGGALKKALMGAASLTGVGSIFAVGGVLSAGLDRLKTIQRAQVQLSLKLSPEEIKRVTTDIQNVVKGTPIALDEALQAVPRALSAGIKPGKELNQYIQDIADAAASTGGQAGFGQIDIIFSQILGKGKLMGEELMQLTENGVDLRSALKDAFNWDDKTLNKNIEKGKVGMREVQTAVEKTWGKNGGLAKSMGKTFDGAVGNLKASIARLGANVLGAIFGNPNDSSDPLRGAIDGVGSLTDKLDAAGKWVAEHKDDIRQVFTKAGDAAKWTGDKISKVVDWFSRVKDIGASAATWISGKWNTLTTTLDTIKSKVEGIFDSLKTKFESVFGENGWFAQQFKKVGELVDKVRDIFGLGPATANAAPDSAPFNPGPRAPGSAPGLAPLPDTPPGYTRSFGTPSGGYNSKGQWVPEPGAAIAPGSFNQGAVMGRVPSGRYVTAEEFKTGDVNTLGDLNKGLGDCTSAIEDLVNIIEGKPTAGRSMWTGTADAWAAEHGFLPTDKPVPGSFQIGFNDSHMQATLPGGDAFNWGSDASAAQRGLDGGQGAWFDGATKHYYKMYGSGGGVWGAGTATSDSIPAMLSNGEHVLTAADVKAMGGQKGVYAFRAALSKGMVPGFAPGGGVDPNQATELNNQLQDAAKAAEIAQAQFNETMNNPDASEIDKLQAQIGLSQAQRALGQMQSDAPIIATGGTPPDRSIENDILNNTDSLALAQQRLADAQSKGDVPYSQMLQMQAAVDQAQRGRDQAIAALNAQNAPTSFIDEFQRTGGFVPVAASNTGVAGTSMLSKGFDMGNQIVGSLIDSGAQLASMAASAATAGAGAPGGGQAANVGIQMGAQALKRGVKYGFDLAGIFADSVVAQLFPFGAPRAIGYDYTNFLPQGAMSAATTTLEKMGADAMKKTFGQGQNNFQIPGQPQPSAAAVPPETTLASPDNQAAPVPLNTDQGIIGPNDPRFVTPPFVGAWPVDPNGAGGGGGGGSWARGGAISIYDQGGILKPGTLALNASRRPEKVLTEKQWASLANLQPAGRDAPMVKIDAIYGMSPDDVAQKIESKQRLAMMRYAGRP